MSTFTFSFLTRGDNGSTGKEPGAHVTGEGWDVRCALESLPRCGPERQE